jgi:peptide/nickel transport system substrate-binding protein
VSEKPILSRRFDLPILHRIEHAIESLSLTGKVIFYTLVAVFIISAVGLLWNVNNAFMITIPRPGGKLVEGIVGPARFINPVLAVTDGDKDITALVYSGLTRIMPDGTLGLDLADSYTLSPDGKVYTFVLRKDALFHDGTPVTAQDVIFTIHKIQESSIKSPKRAYWEGIDVQKIDDSHIRFILQVPYAPFLENTTIGILPEHLWQNLTGEQFTMSDLNTKPIGSGPYKIASIDRAENNVPVSCTLDAFNEYYLTKPYIKTVVFKFYNSEKNVIESYENGDINALSSISPDNATILQQSKARILQASLPRVFAVFFNQSNNPALSAKEVRQALNQAVDRTEIINSVLQGFGSPLDSAVPKSFTNEVQSETDSRAHPDEAIKLLEQNGWLLNASGIREKKVGKDVIPLAFSISTSDAPELKEVADHLQAQWKAIGAHVSVKVVEGGYLNQNIIKPRRYDALLFGQVVNRDLDLYAFWHSSQRTDPGLNVSLYSNATVDKLLETMRVEVKPEAREAMYTKFETISRWYLKTDSIWNIFNHSKTSN